MGATGDCRPCAWFHKPSGCVNAEKCTFCHACEEGDLKKRKKAKKQQNKNLSRCSTSDTLQDQDENKMEHDDEDMPRKVVTSLVPKSTHQSFDLTSNMPSICPVILGPPSKRLATPLIQALTPLLARVDWSSSEPFQAGEVPQHQKLAVSDQPRESPALGDITQRASATAQAAERKPLVPKTLTREVVNGTEWVSWFVPESMLKSGDRSAVSPLFELSLSGRCVQFKLMLFPRETSQGRGGSSFNKKAKGKGYIELKCETELQEACPLSLCLFVGSQPPKGPVVHDFSHSAVKGLPKEIEIWDLDKSVTNGGFIIGAAITP